MHDASSPSVEQSSPHTSSAESIALLPAGHTSLFTLHQRATSKTQSDSPSCPSKILVRTTRHPFALLRQIKAVWCSRNNAASRNQTNCLKRFGGCNRPFILAYLHRDPRAKSHEFLSLHSSLSIFLRCNTPIFFLCEKFTSTSCHLSAATPPSTHRRPSASNAHPHTATDVRHASWHHGMF